MHGELPPVPKTNFLNVSFLPPKDLIAAICGICLANKPFSSLTSNSCPAKGGQAYTSAQVPDKE